MEAHQHFFSQVPLAMYFEIRKLVTHTLEHLVPPPPPPPVLAVTSVGGLVADPVNIGVELSDPELLSPAGADCCFPVGQGHCTIECESCAPLNQSCVLGLEAWSSRKDHMGCVPEYTGS